jgi:hypothetical protein
MPKRAAPRYICILVRIIVHRYIKQKLSVKNENIFSASSIVKNTDLEPNTRPPLFLKFTNLVNDKDLQ